MSIARGTTPTFTLTFSDEELDLTEASNVYVTFKKNSKSLTKTGEDITVSAKQIEVYLDQKETLMFQTGEVKVQANWVMADGQRACSTVTNVLLSEQLLDRVIS